MEGPALSKAAERALAEGRVRPSDVAWTALRLRQGRFSLRALHALDRIAAGRGWTALDARVARAKRLGYRGTFEDYKLVEKWFEGEGLNPF